MVEIMESQKSSEITLFFYVGGFDLIITIIANILLFQFVKRYFVIRTIVCEFKLRTPIYYFVYNKLRE